MNNKKHSDKTRRLISRKVKAAHKRGAYANCDRQTQWTRKRKKEASARMIEVWALAKSAKKKGRK